MQGVLMGITSIIVLAILSNMKKEDGKKTLCRKKFIVELNSSLCKIVKGSIIILSTLSILLGMGVIKKWLVGNEIYYYAIGIIICTIILWILFICLKNKKIIVDDNGLRIYSLFRQYDWDVDSVKCNVKCLPNKIVFFQNGKKIATITFIYYGYKELEEYLLEKIENNKK